MPTYRVGTRLVDLRPEHRSAILALADSLTTEAIDSVNDRDSYKVVSSGTPTMLDSAYLITLGSPGDTLELKVCYPFELGGGLSFRSAAGDTALLEQGAGPFDSRFGQFTITVEAVSIGQPGILPSYRFALLTSSDAPETAPAVISVGDTVDIERIDHPADADLFTFQGTIGQLVTADLEIPADFTGQLRMSIFMPGGSALHAVTADPGIPLGTNPVSFNLEATGTVNVYLINPPASRGHGSYRFVVK